jgi:prevent-host-death family protein
MQITATQLKQNVAMLSQIKSEDIIITKRDKPFAVIVDYDKYQELITKEKNQEIERKIKILENLPSWDLGGQDYQQIKKDMKI